VEEANVALGAAIAGLGIPCRGSSKDGSKNGQNVVLKGVRAE
jgi:hypothetical protein